MEQKIKKLVIAKHFILKILSDVLSGYDTENDLNLLYTWAENFKILSELTNVDIEIKDLFHEPQDFDKIISSYLNLIFENDTLLNKIREHYGEELAHYYIQLSSILALHYFSSIFSHVELFKKIPKHRKKLINSEHKKSDAFIKLYFENFNVENRILNKYFSGEIISLLEKLQIENVTPIINYIKVHEILSHVVNKLLPDYSDIEYNLGRSQSLINKINNCNPGIKSWASYEQIGIDTLRYLLYPEFDTIYFQKRTEDGHQIRDVIIPNHQLSGFWHHIKNEFDSKNIVVEFKNGKQKAEKESLNQLRIYLSKKTIGKFGLLFIRKKPSKSLLLARRLAYEESGILILLIDDSLLKKLIISKALIGSCNELLQKEKIKFEIEY